MKRGLLVGSMTLIVFGMVEAASATLVNFDLAGGAGGSGVTVTDSAKWGILKGALAPDLDSQIFSLNVGETKVVNFFTLKAAGVAWQADYQVTATLAFDLPSPMDPAVGQGAGQFSTFLGLLSGGTLSWITQPADFVLADGNTISVSFEEGQKVGIGKKKVGLGNRAMVHAYITNQGGGVAGITNENEGVAGITNEDGDIAEITNDNEGPPPTNAPVPEPATMFLFGAGLVSFAGLTLNRKRK